MFILHDNLSFSAILQKKLKMPVAIQHISEYEKLRAKNIEENKKMLESLGLLRSVSNFLLQRVTLSCSGWSLESEMSLSLAPSPLPPETTSFDGDIKLRIH